MNIPQHEVEFLKEYEACQDALAWLKGTNQPSLADAWKVCHRSDWMLWLLRTLRYKDERTLRLIACSFVRETPLGDGRTVWDLLTDERSRKAVEVSERYVKGEADRAELRAAYAAAAAVASRAAHAVHFANAANHPYAARAAARAADYAADAIYYAGIYAHDPAVEAAVDNAARSAQSDIVRRFIPELPNTEHLR